MNRSFLGIGVVGLFYALVAGAVTPDYREVKDLSLKAVFHTKRDWHVSAWQPLGMKTPDVDAAMGNRAAKLCFRTIGSSDQSNCTLIQTMPPDSQFYPYQTAKSFTVRNPAQTNVPRPLIAFQAEYSGGGGGLGEQVTFWAYDEISDSFEQAGLITLTDESEYQFVSAGGCSAAHYRGCGLGQG